MVASRTLTPGLVAQLAGTLHGSVTLEPAKDLDSAPLRGADASSVTIQLSSDNASGSALLHDSSGRAVRVLRFTRSVASGEIPAGAPSVEARAASAM